MRKKTIILTVSLCCILSCERRPLDILASGLRIDHTPDYTLTYEAPAKTPEHFRVNMYDALSGELSYKDFIQTGGGIVKSVPGSYTVWLANFDEGNLLLSGENNINTLYLTGPSVSTEVGQNFAKCKTKLKSALITKGVDVEAMANEQLNVEQPVITVAEHFWSGTAKAYIPAIAESDELFAVKVKTSSVPKQGWIELDNITGAENISLIECYITNLAAGVNPVTLELNPKDVTEHFTLDLHGDKASGPFLYFGINGGQTPRLLYVLITDTAGGKYLYVYDIGPIDDERGLDFNVDSAIDVPEPETEGGGGFQPVLGDWEVEYVSIPLG